MTSILLVPQKTYPCNHAMLESVYSKLLPAKGYEIYWLMFSANVRRATVADWNGTIVYLLPLSKKTGVLALIFAPIDTLRMAFYIYILHKRHRFDIIQVRNLTWISLFVSCLLSNSKTKFIYQFSFPFPERDLEAAKQGRTRLAWYVKASAHLQIAVRSWAMRRADLVLAISDEMRRQLIEQGIVSERVMSFPLGAEIFSTPLHEEIEEIRVRFRLGSNPIVLYFGSISWDRRLDFLIEVAVLVNRECPETKWLFLGDAYEKEDMKLKNLAIKYGINDSIRFVGPVERSQVPVFLALATISVSPIPTTPLYWLSSPTKVVESLAMGCPVVSTPIPDSAAIITASGGGMLAPFEKEAFADVVCRALKDSIMREKMSKSGQAYVSNNRSYAILANMIEKKYRQLLEFG